MLPGLYSSVRLGSPTLLNTKIMGRLLDPESHRAERLPASPRTPEPRVPGSELALPFTKRDPRRVPASATRTARARTRRVPAGPAPGTGNRGADPTRPAPPRAHRADGRRPSPVQQRRGLPGRRPGPRRPPQQRRRLVVVHVASGPRHLFGDVGHVPPQRTGQAAPWPCLFS